MDWRSRKVLSYVLMLVLLVTALPVAAAQQPSGAGKIEQALLDKFAAEGRADFIVRFAEQADLSPAYTMGWQERGEFVVKALTATAERSQAHAKSVLDARGLRYQTFIAGNELYVWAGDLSSAQSLAALFEVDLIRATRTYSIDPIIGPEPDVQPNALAWGITYTKADQFWSAFGMQGDGMVVANIDTGVQYDHPALDQAYRCPGDPGNPACWLDPSDVCPGDLPCDNNGHGTHTMGTMVGDDDPSLTWQAGMAPGAQWIACKGCESNSCSDFALNTCADWILAPGGNSANRPHVVNNSWGGGGCDTWYQAKVQAWRAAGVFPAFSAGNSGPSCNSLGSPGDYQESFGSAAHDSSGNIASFSSRGPSCFGHDPYTKPNIAAPGVSVCSSVPTNGWSCGYSGTSMASPHSAGAVALLWSCNPSLVGQIDQTFEILQDNAAAAPGGNCGAPPDGEGNYTYGYGYLDIYAAGLLWCGAVGYLDGHVTDSSTSAPIAGATVTAVKSGFPPAAATTNAQGYYTKTLTTGTYTVTASAYGYMPETVAGVAIITDTVTTQDFALDPVPSYVVDGYVTDATTGWPLYARIDIAGYPYGPVWTDPESGYYSVELAGGIAYTFHVSAWVGGYLPEDRPVGPLTGPQTEDFALIADAESCSAPGYHPQCYYFEGFEAGNGGFTVQGTSSWAWGVPTSGPGEAHGGNNVWATNLTGNYGNSENGYLTSPDIDLSGLAGLSIYFSWWQWLVSESNYDYASVEVSNNGGGSWEVVYGPISGPIDPEWTKQYVTLDPSYAVSNFRVRFHFTSDGSVVYEGWYVDDICITGVPPPTTVYSQNFDSNNGGYTTGGTASSWAWGAPTSGPGAAHSPPNVWATNLTGNYNTNEDSWVQSPDIDLSPYAGQGIYLSWWHWLWTESCCDYAEVQVSNNGGGSWTTVWGPTYGGAHVWEHPTVVLGPAYAVNNFRLRFHLYTDYSVEYAGFYVDDVVIAVGEAAAVPCVVDPGGLVVGNVYDENTLDPLVGALVVNEAGSMMVAQPTPDDPNVDDAFYTLFSPPGDNVFTATMAGYAPDTELVTVVQSDTVRQDFFLGAGWLVVEPTSLAATLNWGDAAALPLTLTNAGSAAATFEMVERDKGFQPPLYRADRYVTVSVPPIAARPGIAARGGARDWPAREFTMHIDRLSLQPINVLLVTPDVVGGGDISLLLNTLAAFPDLAVTLWDGNAGTPTVADMLAYDVVFVGNDILWTSSAIDKTVLSNNLADYIDAGGKVLAGSFIWSYDDWGLGGGRFIAEDYSPYEIATMDIWNPATLGAYDPSHPIMDGITNVTDNFNHQDPALSPNGTWVASWSDGENFVAVSPNCVGLNQEYFHNADFGGQVGELLHNAILFLAVSADVPWLSESPISGTVGAGESLVIDVTLDSSVVAQPGHYYAELRVKNDTPYDAPKVAVTMTVLPRGDMGKVAGTVADNCTGGPLEEVLVTFTGGDPITQTQSNAQGYYTAWLVSGTYPVRFTLDGYLDYETTVEVLAGVTTTLDVSLIPDRPCIAVEPAEFEVWLITGTAVYTHSTGLNIRNDGGRDLAYEIREREGGYSPPLVEWTRTPPTSGPVAVTGAAPAGYVPQPAPAPTGIEGPWQWRASTPFATMDNVYVDYEGMGYLVSGYGSGGQVGIYNPNTDSWTTGASEPAPQIEYTVDACLGLDGNGDPVIVLFNDTTSGATTLHRYNIANNSWDTPPVPAGFPSNGLWAHDVTSVLRYNGQNICYISGGATTPGGGNQSTLYAYYPDTNTVDNLGNFTLHPAGFDFHASWFAPWIGSDGAICVGGGVDAGSTVFADTQCYDIGAGIFNPPNADLGPMLEGVWGMADGVLYEGGDYQLWIANGADAGFALWPNSMYYSANDGQWHYGPTPLTTVYRVEGVNIAANDGCSFYVAAGSTGGFTPSTGHARNFSSECPPTGAPADVWWVWEDPVSGTVAAQTSGNVGIFFSALYTDATPMPLGTYTATMMVVNNAGRTVRVPVTMHIIEQVITPTADFTATSPACLGEEMWFYFTGDPGNPSADAYTWDFGDGISVTVGTPDPVPHTYAAPGTYDVSLEVCITAWGACDSVTGQVEVLPLPVAAFTYTANLLTVAFTDQSQNATAWAWDFGDGATSTETNPIHTYAGDGTYTVVLTVTGVCGSDTVSMDITVTGIHYSYIYIPLITKGYTQP